MTGIISNRVISYKEFAESLDEIMKETKISTEDDEMTILQRIEASRNRIADMNADNKLFDPEVAELDPKFILLTLRDARDQIQESTKLLSKFATLIISVRVNASTDDLTTAAILQQVNDQIKKNKF